MRKLIAFFLSFLIIICSFTIICIFLTEKTDFFQLSQYRPEYTFQERDGKTTLSWKRYPYPCFYQIETFYKSTGELPEAPEYHRVHSDYVFSDNYQVPNTAIPAYYTITAYGIFGKISSPKITIENARFQDPLRPTSIYHYTPDNPASLKPYLVWHSIPDGVIYELELLSGPPDEEYTTRLSTSNHLFNTQQIFTNGIQINLSPYIRYNTLYWRVRALNLRKEPVGVFSKAERIYIDPARSVPNKPLLNNFDRMPNFQQPIYPVFNWIPMAGVDRYEVELLTAPPAEENNTAFTANRAWAKMVQGAFSCYDEYPRYYAGTYYWRVRGIDAQGHTVGVYSDTDSFTVPSHFTRPALASFGDSITHGGGAVSFSPANLEYSYLTYLDVPAINIGRSGDTSHTSLLRFDQDVLPIRPINLLIMTGSNSLRASNITSAMIIQDLQGIIDKCKANDIRPILMTLPPINPANIQLAFHTDTDPNWRTKMQQVNKFIRSQTYYIDLEPHFYEPSHQQLAPCWANDGLHSDIRGKMLMAEIINQHLNLLAH